MADAVIPGFWGRFGAPAVGQVDRVCRWIRTTLHVLLRILGPSLHNGGVEFALGSSAVPFRVPLPVLPHE